MMGDYVWPFHEENKSQSKLNSNVDKSMEQENDHEHMNSDYNDGESVDGLNKLKETIELMEQEIEMDQDRFEWFLKRKEEKDKFNASYLNNKRELNSGEKFLLIKFQKKIEKFGQEKEVETYEIYERYPGIKIKRRIGNKKMFLSHPKESGDTENAQMLYEMGKHIEKTQSGPEWSATMLEYYQKSIKQDPFFILSYWRIFCYNLECGELEKSHEIMKSVFQLDRTDPQFQLALGDFCFEFEQYIKAQIAFAQYLIDYPEDDFVNSKRANCFLYLNQNEDSLVFYDKAIKINPYQSQSFLNKAQALFDAGKIEEAIQAINISLSLDPNDEISLCVFAYFLQMQEQFEESLDAFKKSIALQPTSNGYTDLSYYLIDQFEIYEALEVIDKAFQEGLFTEQLFKMKCVIFRIKESYEEAEQVLQEGLKFFPESLGLLIEESLILQSKSENYNAQQILQCLLERDLENFQTKDLFLFACSLFYDSDQYDEVNTYLGLYEKMTDEKDYQESYFLRKNEYLQINSLFVEQIELLDQAILKYPLSKQLFRQKAFVYYRLEQYEESIQMITMAIGKRKPSAEDLMIRADNYIKLKQYNQAIQDCKELKIQLSDSKIQFQYGPSYIDFMLSKCEEMEKELSDVEELGKDLKHVNKETEQNLNILKEVFVSSIVMNFVTNFKQKKNNQKQEESVIYKSIQLESNYEYPDNMLTNKIQEGLINKVNADLKMKEEKNEDVNEYLKKVIEEMKAEQKAAQEKQMEEIRLLKLNQENERIKNQQLVQKLEVVEIKLEVAETKIVQHQQIMEDAGVVEKAFINRRIKLIKEEGGEVYNYWKTFYWTSLNTIQAYRTLSTKYFKQNYKSESLKFVEENGETIQEGISKCLDFICKNETLHEVAGYVKEFAVAIPIVGSIVGCFDQLFKISMKAGIAIKDLKEQTDFSNKMNAIVSIIREKFDSEEDVSLKMLKTATELAEKKKEELRNPQPEEEQNFLVGISRDFINVLQDLKQKVLPTIELHDKNSIGAITAVQDVLLLVNYLSQNRQQILKNEESIDSQMVKAIISEECLKGLPQSSEGEEENEGNQLIEIPDHSYKNVSNQKRENEEDIGPLETPSQNFGCCQSNSLCHIF